MTSQKEKILKKLEKLYDSLDSPGAITREKYLRICEQSGKEPDPDRIPPDWEDFPDIVHAAVHIFNSLGDRVYPEIGYTGKDYTNLELLLKRYDIHNQEFLLDLVFWLDQRAIVKASAELKREYEKLKRKK